MSALYLVPSSARIICVALILASAVVAAEKGIEISQYELSESQNVTSPSSSSSSSSSSPSSLTKSVPARSDIECSMLCSQQPNSICSSFTFREQQQLCDMRNHSVQHGFDRFDKFDLDLLNQTYVTRNGTNFTIFQQRQQGHIWFNRSKEQYEDGFGDSIDFWLGLKPLHEILKAGARKMRVEAKASDGFVYTCEYLGFDIDGGRGGYKMSYSGFIAMNMTEDSLAQHVGRAFSTMDNDKDENKDINCAANGAGGWYFSNCARCNPNGKFSSGSQAFGEAGMFWFGAGGSDQPLQWIRMMVEVL